MSVVLEPFPHWVLDGWWDAEQLAEVRDSFPEPDWTGWKTFANRHEHKMGSIGSRVGWPLPVCRFLDKLEDGNLCELLARLFKINGSCVPDVWGGGMHMIPPGGKLDIHVDFNKHPSGLYRRLNCLIYLNDWEEGMGGELELRIDEHTPSVTLAPQFNRTVIFETSDHSWHGHPNPTTANFWRKSIAVYYYSDEPPPGYVKQHDTIFEAA